VNLWRWRAQRSKGDSRTGWRALYGVLLFSAIVGYIALQNSEYFNPRKQKEKEKVEYPIEIANFNLNTTNKTCPHRCTIEPGVLVHDPNRIKHREKREAWITMLANDNQVGIYNLSYADGVEVLVHTLQEAGTTREILVLVDPEGVSEYARTRLSALNVTLVEKPVITPPKNARRGFQTRMRFSFNKLWTFSLENYTKLVYIDGDIFVLPTCPNVDRMFEYTAPAAALEFNQNKTRGAIRQCGLYVLEPDQKLLEDMLEKREDTCNYPVKGVDTGFMSCYFKDYWQTINQVDNMQHFCNSKPFGPSCKDFYDKWWNVEEVKSNICAVHDKFFRYTRKRYGANRAWYKAHDAVRSRLKALGYPVLIPNQKVNSEGHVVAETAEDARRMMYSRRRDHRSMAWRRHPFTNVPAAYNTPSYD